MNFKKQTTSILLILLLFLIFKNQAQIVDIKNFKSIESAGTIPADFTKLTSEKYLDELLAIEAKSKEDEKLQKEFYAGTFYYVDELLMSGRVTFGDPISIYGNSILDRILKEEPELRKKIRLYHLKSPSMNASATSQGILFLNTGLLATIENEAQLAFVICHELSHYLQKHSLESFYDNVEYKKGKGPYGGLSNDEKIEQLFRQKIENEYEADSLGLIRYLKLGYDSGEAIKFILKLYYSYLPLKQSKVDCDFLSQGQLKIPEVFFKRTLKTISEIEAKDDTYKTHPDILKRRDSLLNNINVEKEGAVFLESDKIAFEKVKLLAQYEYIRLLFLSKNYSDVIYNATTLLKEFKNDEFLELAIVKALYGLASYRNAEEYQLVTNSYNRAEGESQQVYYLFKQLNPIQLNIIALKHIRTAQIKYNSYSFLTEMEKELVQALVCKNDIKPDYFSRSVIDFKVTENLDSLKPIELKKLQKKYSDFGRNAFVGDSDFENLKLKMDEAMQNKACAETEKYITYKEERKKKKEEDKLIREKGLGRPIGNISILDPIYVDINPRKGKDLIKAHAKKQEFDDKIFENIQETSLKITYLSSTKLKKSNIQFFNKMSYLKEWREELLTKNICEALPLSNTYVKSLGYTEDDVLCMPGLFELNGNLYYNLSFYTITNGQKLFENRKKVSGINDAISQFNKDLQILTK